MPVSEVDFDALKAQLERLQKKLEADSDASSVSSGGTSTEDDEDKAEEETERARPV